MTKIIFFHAFILLSFVQGQMPTWVATLCYPERFTQNVIFTLPAAPPEKEINGLYVGTMDEPYRWSVFSSTVDGARPGDEVTFDVSINPPSYAPEGLHTFNVDVFDENEIAYGLNIRAEITIQCTVPPTPCDSATASPSVIWPVNHKMVQVGIEMTEPATIAILSIEQNEPVDDKGDGKTSPDGQILEDGRALIRAERSGIGTEGRTYRIKFEASSGTDTCEGTVSVCVPHDRSRPCSDNGRAFIDSTAVVLNRNLRSNH